VIILRSDVIILVKYSVIILKMIILTSNGDNIKGDNINGEDLNDKN